MESTLNRTIRYLQDVHAAEKLAEDLLDNLASDKEAVPEITLASAVAAKECVARRETISARLQALGGQTSGMKDLANSVAGVIGDIANAGHDRNDKITMDAIKSHGALHVLHASYMALGSFAKLVNDAETETIAAQHGEQAMKAAESLIPAIEASARSVYAVA
jgi:hypothetical protein